MSTFDRLRFVWISCVAATLFGFVPAVHAQSALADQQQELLDESFSLDPEMLLGDADEPEAELPLLVDKSTIADLDFLNTGEAPASIEQLKAMQEHVAAMYDRVEPAVVNIQSGMGQGSGVVITSDGYVLTAAHVISVPNRRATITFADGKRARAQTLGLFRTLDAGLLKIYEVLPERKSKDKEDSDEEDSDEEDSDEEDSDEEDSDEEDSDEEDSGEEDSGEEDSGDENSDDEEEPVDEDPFKVQEDLPSFRYLDIGDSADLNLGQWVLAVGHPGGLDKDRGIVLRVGRINIIDADADNAYLRTDCMLVGGDSGGPLIGMDGSVVGIHSRIGQKLEHNFHVPSNNFVDLWADLLVPVVHDRDAQLSVSFRGKTNVISDVPRRSMAARYGLKTSDRIIRVGDQEVYDELQFDDAISKLKPFQKVKLEIQRRGEKQTIEVVMGEKKDER